MTITDKARRVARLLGGTMLAVAPTVVLAQAPASPQATPAPANEQLADEGEDIVVTGYRAANRAAVQAKQNSDVLLDAISQDDIGRLPDLNIVETARRIVGLSTVGGQDPTKSRDIYQRVTIRGLDPRYNLITLDGVPIASSEWTVRGARLEQFPNSLVSRIEAIKTITAQFDPHGLGGQLNVVSRSAFDAPTKQFFVVNASAGQNSTSGSFLSDDRLNVRADATGSLRFGADEQFGVTVSAEYQKLRSAVNSELPGDTNGDGWTYYTAAGARTPFASLSRDGIMVPIRPQDFRFDNKRSRFSVNGKLEFRPSDAAHLSLFAGYYKDKDEEFRAEILTVPGGTPTNVTATSGTFPLGDLQQGIVLQPQERETLLFTGKGDFALASNVNFNLTASYSNASYYEQRIFQKWAGSVTPGRVASVAIAPYGFTYTLANGSPLATHLQPDRGSDPANYVNLYIRDVRRYSDSEVAFLKGELDWNGKRDDRGFGARVGAAYTSTLQKFNVTYEELTPANAAAQAQVGGLTNFIYPDRFMSRDHARTPYLVIDPSKVGSFVDANRGLFIATDQRANNFADDFRDVEDVAAVYGQGLFRTDHLSLIAGLRYDSTKVDARTFQVPTIVGSTAYERVTRKSSYDFLLPSVLATYNFTDAIRLTAGYSKTIGRPDFSQYAARTSYAIGTTPGVLTINTGNPDLKPREADNYDLSFEWYLPRGGLFSVAVFKKDIANEIFTARQQGPATTYLGVNYTDVTIAAPFNSSTGQVKGLEISYTQDSFAFLPDWLKGLGVNANATLLDGSFVLPVSAAGQAIGQGATRNTSGLIQQPDYMLNGTVFYSTGPFEARLSYNKIGRALQQVNQDTPERDLYQEPRDQIDAQIRWSVGAGFDLVGQVQNLTEKPFVVRQGPDRAYLNNFFPVGRTFWLGFSWKPGR